MNSKSINEKKAVKDAIALFRREGGILRTSEAMAAGIHQETLYAMRKAGLIETMARGVNRLAELQEPGMPDLVIVARKIPRAVICLVSALSYHEITTQIPHAVEIMLPRDTGRPRLSYPPIEVHTTIPELYELGQEQHDIDGTTVRIYNVEKTLVDCVKYRNQLGTESVIEALRLYRDRKPLKVDKLMDYARVCRVHKTLSAYLEGIL